MSKYDEFCAACHKLGMVPIPYAEWELLLGDYMLEIYVAKRLAEERRKYK